MTCRPIDKENLIAILTDFARSIKAGKEESGAQTAAYQLALVIEQCVLSSAK